VAGVPCHTSFAYAGHADEQAANQAVSDIAARRTDQQSHHYEQRAFFQHEAENSMIGAPSANLTANS